MKVDVETEIAIERPVGIVADFAADPEKAPLWYGNIVSARWETEPPLQAGSHIRFEATFLGRTLAYTYEVIAYVPDELLMMRTSEGPFPMETTYRWEAVDATTTRMRLRNRGEPAGFARFMRPLMSAAIRRANRKDLATLRRLLVADGVPG